MIKWDDSWPIGIAEIDYQHHRLVDLTNDLAAAMLKGQGRAEIFNTFKNLANYTIEHFSDEEAMMEECDYKDLENQQKEHEEFRRKLAEFIVNYQNGAIRIPNEVLVFLAEWLRDHTHGSDRKFGKYWQEQQLLKGS
ncbi:bacteriohemerythrin [bacterium]|nr:bacteriohemerythrin [bacterium]